MHLKKNLNKNLKNLFSQKRKSMIQHQVISFMLMTIIFSQFILTSATDLNTANIMDSKKDLDCIRLQFFLKTMILRIQRLELNLLQKMNNFAKLPYELAEIESLCSNNGQLQPEILKRNFDEIDRSGFRGFSKKNFDEIDKVGFRNFMGR